MNDDDLFGQPAPPLPSASAAQPVSAAPATAQAAPPGGIDPLVVQTGITEAGTDPTSLRAWASVIRNRVLQGGESPTQVLLDPGQFQTGVPSGSPEAAAKAKSLAIRTDSPAYQAALQVIAPIVSGAEPPVADYTYYYSPKAQAQYGRPKPTWDDGTGTNIGGNLYFTHPYGSPPTANLTPDQQAQWSSLTGAPTTGPDAGKTGQSPPNAFPVDPAIAARIAKVTGHPVNDADLAHLGQATIQNAAQSGNAQWPIYDPANQVGRNQDGSIAWVGQPPLVNGGPNGNEIEIRSSGDPSQIAAWKKAHPLDPSNQGPVARPTVLDTDTLEAPNAFDNLSRGVTQGLSNVGHSLQDFDANVRANPVGNAFMTGLTGQYVDPAAERASLGQFTMSRNANDVNYGNSNAYGIGKFGGEVAGTLPVMAATGGLSDVAGAGLAGTKFAPVADFMAGQTPGALLGARGASLATSGALQGGEAAGLTSAGSSQPLGQQVGQGAIGGAVLSPALPVLGRMGQALTQGPAAKIASNIAPEVSALADTAVNKFGIPLRASQIAGTADRNMAVKDSQLISAPGSGFAANNVDQAQAFTRAVSRTMGEDSPSITPTVMSAAKTRIGGVFNRVAANTTIQNADAVQSKLGSVIQDAQQVLPDGDVAPLLRQVEKIGSVVEPGTNGMPGTISGRSYQALVSKGSPLDRLTSSSDPNVRFYASQIKDVLDDGLQASAAPSDLADLQAARLQYKNMKTIEPLIDKAGPSGLISPLLLRGRVSQSFSNSAYTGAGDLGQLAQIGQTFMKEPPNSGTPARLKDMILSAPGLAGAADLGLALHDPMLAAKLGAAGVGAAGLRYGNNMLQGAKFGAKTAEQVVGNAPPANKFLASPIAKAVNDNIVPVGVIGANRMQQAYGQ